MDALALARWQFGITTVYHFLFVPLTIGLTWLVAIMQTKWTKSGSVTWYRLTRLFGKLFLINFAAGVVTGIVQEFQFGMNWSEYSRFVGDIFGAPLALEALIAFFMESTFVGLWIFGWNKLSKKVHLLMIYLTAIGTTISSIFILAANSWMQNPVGAKLVQLPNGSFRAELTDFLALIKNPFFLVTFPHVLSAAFMLSGGLILGVAGWWLAKGRKKGDEVDDTVGDKATWRAATRFGAWAVLIASVFSIVIGDIQGKIEGEYQPLKLAASEGVTDPNGSDAFAIISVFSGGATEGTAKTNFTIAIPKLLSLLAYTDTSTKVPDVNALAQSVQVFSYCTADGACQDFAALPEGSEKSNVLQTSITALANDPTITAIQGGNGGPSIWASFYTFRFMVLFGILGLLFSIFVLVKTKKGALPSAGKGWTTLMIAMVLMPEVATACGWLVTELGRQPWLVYGVLPTSAGVSPGVSAGEVFTSMVLYTLIYAVVAVIVVNLFLKVIHSGLPDGSDAPGDTVSDDDAILHFAY